MPVNVIGSNPTEIVQVLIRVEMMCYKYYHATQLSCSWTISFGLNNYTVCQY